MKKTASLGALLLALVLPLAAQAETVFAGEVTAETAQVIAAPYGGLVEDVRVRVGDSVKIGDPIATVETAKTYASTDGTVSGVFAHEGDSADGVKTQYGALVYIEPINRFTLACSTEKGYNSSENRYIHIGETVFLKCTKDGSHQGRGVVTGLDEKDDSKFTVEVTGGEFYMGETVDIYRSGDYGRAGGCLPLPVPEDVPFYVKDYSEYYKGRAYHPRSLNSTEGWNTIGTLSFLNQPILCYSNEIRSAVLIIHGEKAHSCYMGRDAYANMMKGNPCPENKELLIIPGAVHTDLYDGGGKNAIPFDKMVSFFQKAMA